MPRAADEGRFYALWRRENPTTIGEPFTFIDTGGRGHIVGAILQAQGFEPANTSFFEGDDQATLDGELVIHGAAPKTFSTAARTTSLAGGCLGCRFRSAARSTRRTRSAAPAGTAPY